ncbi:T9SS type A sorting domain-containing protein [Algibacter amylolyticus]|uniref:T9SS type A sorting domain-containing protein n=1 Tax=Algibacter amylolyticus TaxID=1608400 RepID=A0A5M7B7J8_9FLAO|nr:LamG-like jellyroll fold domain-containing protein [Algibacter amylolyticus]KAA5824187.1 T9SS type A sorting domain-containing protein [Algibacter amylolyticus]MBB5269747.1 hypothetical protein [Algibacter amylolyticus]TSJ74664.1 T9SS type A sorting domain-containing protein [Algibacter amylolyticus]
MMMRRELPTHFLQFTLLIIFSFFSLSGKAQVAQVEVLGGAIITEGSTIGITEGNSLDFRITNLELANCDYLKIQDVNVSNTSDFDVSPNSPATNIKPLTCLGGDKFLDFEVETTSLSCGAKSTLVTIEISNQANFTFTLQINASPEIFVLGGSPYADIYHGDTVTSALNGTFFGIVDKGTSITRTYVISNIGSCNLDVLSLTSSNGDFVASSMSPIPSNNINPYNSIAFNVTFTAPATGSGTQTSVISVGNSGNTTFTFTVKAELYDFSIPGPGGILAEFRLWLKSTRGVTETASKVSVWADLGTNGKDATQPIVDKQPTYLDTEADNINYNPVIKFENDGASLEQYLQNSSDGFYSQDIFIVMIPDTPITSASSRSTIFSGTVTGLPGDITGVGFGDYSGEFSNEVLSYNQGIPLSLPLGLYNGVADEATVTYDKPGIINVRNNLTASAQELLYNSDIVSTSTVNDIPYLNIGITEVVAPFTVYGSEYWIGRNMGVQGSLNGRIAEIFTYAERVTDTDRHKIESYLGIKYGITLGSNIEAEKDYINSFGTKTWDITTNSGFNYNIAGIGKDSISDLNQKQSKTLNFDNEVTISLGNVFATNNLNTNEFKKDGDFIVWGNNNGPFTGSGTNTVTVATGITTAITRIDRTWKIVESNEHVNGDVETVYVSIPSAAFSGFSKTATEEYALIVADNASFGDGDIIDVIPLRSSDSGLDLRTWYDFDGTKYFTFGKVSKLSEKHTVDIEAGDYLVGESEINLNVDNFTISAWIKCSANASNRTLMAKGEKLQMRLNSSGNIEVYMDDNVTPKYTSNMVLDDGKWHQATYIFDSGTILMYIDGILDKSVQNIVHPTPNYNNYCIGALYIDKDTVTNPLLGSIEEVYIWDVALSHDQVRFLMNQEIERFNDSGTDYVSGKIIPQASACNETASIPWSRLRVYYDFNSLYGSTIEGLTDERYFLRLKYLNKDKTLIDEQTAPLPYVTAADGTWDTAGCWLNSANMAIPNSLGLDGVTTIDWNIVETAHNISSGDRDITLLGLIQTAGVITIADPIGFQDETNSGQGLTISHYLELDGVIDLIGESQLIQKEGSIVDADSGGFIERDQQGTANGYNYNYWSSSVGPISGNTLTRGTGMASANGDHTISNVLNDGSFSAFYQSLLFSSSPDGSGTPPPPGLAKTISTYWLYKFYGTADSYNSWAKISETTPLMAGEGFTMKGTSGSVSITTMQNYVFTGLPNNGDITLPLDSSTEEVDRLIGNPYPSAIDAEAFILDNLSVADGGTNPNGTVINGALYFWDHFGEENSHNLAQYVGGYATRNLIGGAPAIANDSRLNATGGIGTKVPGEYIGVNQGFFVSTLLDGFENDNGATLTKVDGGDIVFKNSQRVFAKEDGTSSLFFKSANAKNNKVQVHKDNTPRIKLRYNSPMGYNRQIILGANTNASKNFDVGYDAFMVDVCVEDMYWVLENKKLVIQGVDKFNDIQEYDIGLNVKQAGLVKIELEALENLAENTPVYIKDLTTNETFPINDNAFELYLEAGEYTERFKLVFNNTLLSVENSVEESDKILVYYANETKQLNIINKSNYLVNDLAVYNLLGQEIKTLKLNTTEDKSIYLPLNTGMYIIDINSEVGNISKKIIAD